MLETAGKEKWYGSAHGVKNSAKLYDKSDMEKNTQTLLAGRVPKTGTRMSLEKGQ